MTRASTPWCSASAPCRIDWRPSRALAAALILLSLAAPAAVLASEMPRAAAWLLSAAALVHGAWLAARDWRRPPRRLLFTGDGRLLVDGEEAAAPCLRWRGPLAFLSWRDGAGRVQRLAWWPDTLPPSRRRALRLAFARLPAAPYTPSVAP